MVRYSFFPCQNSISLSSFSSYGVLLERMHLNFQNLNSETCKTKANNNNNNNNNNKVMEYKDGSNMNHIQSTGNNHQATRKDNGGTTDSNDRGCPNLNSIRTGKNTSESPGEFDEIFCYLDPN